MKTRHIFLYMMMALLAFGCKDGYIDEISRVDPGDDEGAPDVTINYPVEGTEVKVFEQVASIDIDFEVTDDIEIASVTLTMDGAEIVSYTEFLDYRILRKVYTYDQLTDGEHTLEVSATDMEGNNTSVSVTFEKVPPYEPQYRGEMFYMPFEGDYIDLVSVTFPTEVGSPGFVEEGLVGSAYDGAENAYLTFPTEDFAGTNEFSASFWLKMDAVTGNSGVLVASAPDDANPDAPNNRNFGFRLFHEPAGDNQVFKLNVGTGEGEAWFDGGEAAQVDPSAGEWVHFGISLSENYGALYINGNAVSEGEMAAPIDWTGVDNFSIMSGAPYFTGWSHLSETGALDELRMFNVALTESEIQQILTDDGGSVGPAPGIEFEEIFYMPFDGDFSDAFSGTEATQEGTPGFAGESKDGSDAYAGAADAYLTFPAADLMNEEFSATFWMKINNVPDRAGILVISPPDPDNPGAENVRTSGFRFFREAAGDNQIFKLNVGLGEGEQWFDGGEAAHVDPTTGEWVHFAFTISGTMGKVYIDGTVVSENEITGISWADCESLSIMSGVPHFTGWEHFSDESLLDELRIFDRELTQEEIDAIIASDAK